MDIHQSIRQRHQMAVSYTHLFIRFKTNLLLEDAGKDPIKRAELIGNLVQSISVIPEAIVRDVYINCLLYTSRCV